MLIETEETKKWTTELCRKRNKAVILLFFLFFFLTHNNIDTHYESSTFLLFGSGFQLFYLVACCHDYRNLLTRIVLSNFEIKRKPKKKK